MFGKKDKSVKAEMVLDEKDAKVFSIQAEGMTLPFLLVKTEEESEKKSATRAEVNVIQTSGEGERSTEENVKSNWKAIFNRVGMGGYEVEDWKTSFIGAASATSGDQISQDIPVRELKKGEIFSISGASGVQAVGGNLELKRVFGKKEYKDGI